jgi:hypothetical protein
LLEENKGIIETGKQPSVCPKCEETLINVQKTAYLKLTAMHACKFLHVFNFYFFHLCLELLHLLEDDYRKYTMYLNFKETINTTV